MWYKAFLPKVHEIISPDRYVEIRIRHGYSLSLSPNAKKIAIDPSYAEADMQFPKSEMIGFKESRHIQNEI